LLSSVHTQILESNLQVSTANRSYYRDIVRRYIGLT